MKASWSGFISVGNLAVPVKLYAVTQEAEPHFIQVHLKDLSPIKRVAVCQKDGKPVPADEVGRAADYNGQLVELTQKDMEGGRSSCKDISVKQFTDPRAINPLYYEKAYFVAPAKGGELGYTLLREALGRAQKVAVATFLFYQREHVGIIMPHDGILLLHQLRFSTQLVPRSSIPTPSLPQPNPNQLDLAVQLIQRYAAPFYIEDYRNEHADYLNELIARKAKGMPPKRMPAANPHTTPEDDVLPTLQHMLESTTPPLVASGNP